MACNRGRSRRFRAMFWGWAGLGVSPLGSGTVAFVLAATGTAPAGAQQTAPAQSIVLDRVTVVDVEQGKLLPEQRVVIVGNRIQAVGGGQTVPVPQGAQVVDARGKYLIPGLWDIHTHPRTLAHLFYPLFIANGITGIRDAWSEIPLDTLVRWRREILAGTRIGPPRQLLAGQALNDTDPADAQRHVDSLKAAGANFIKTYPFSFALAAAARRAGLPFGGHVNSENAIDVSDSGASIVDHVNSAGGLDKLCMGPEASVEQCRPVAERFRRNNTWWVPTLSRRLGFNSQAEPNPGPVSRAIVERFHDFADRFWAGSAVPSGWLHDVMKVDATDSLRFLSVMQQVGLPILAGTDAGAPVRQKSPPGFSLHVELAIYVTEGMPPLEALRAATLYPAKMLHGTDSLGTIAPGKLADLVLLDADPLVNITNTTTISAVIANGRYFDRAALDNLFAEVQAKGQQEP